MTQDLITDETKPVKFELPNFENYKILSL